MSKYLSAILASCALVLSSASAFASDKSVEARTLFMAGDSTMAIKESKDYPEMGWGVPFADFFSENLTVVNLAKNGRSTRTFKEEGLWEQIESNLKKGDWVIIQFGHNDESAKKKDRYSPPEQYKQNLTQMIEIVRAKGAHPILMSSVTRRQFNKDGSMKLTHPYYPLVQEVAKATQVEYIDMDQITRTYFTELGFEASALRFMHIMPDLHPNYPFGVTDNTHFNELGAREVAQLVLKELKARKHPLVEYLRATDPKHLKLKYKGKNK